MFAWKRGIRNFKLGHNHIINQPWTQGLLLLICVIVAMLLANLPMTKHIYHEFLETSLALSAITPDGHEIIFPHGMSVEKFINDILMVIFFFTIGLEIKREVVYGELSSFKKAMLPIIAALGGVIVPALIYLFINKGTMATSGWGIPTATDIAFAVGILSILSDRVPISLKVFLTALAIADDLMAILVVAFFYGGSINLSLLAIALGIIIVLAIFNYLGEKRTWFYLIPGFVVWALFYYSGIHATMSGVVLAFVIPMGARYSKYYYYRTRKLYRERIAEYDHIHEDGGFPNGLQRECLRRLSDTSKNCVGLSYRLEHSLSPWVNYLIMPIFALANAGVTITDISYFNITQYDPQIGSVGLGIFLGLVLGKPLGIGLASFIAIKTKIGAMPAKANFKMLFAVACLGGIGFTMSIFVDTLSFSEHPEVMDKLRNMGKIAVLLASLSAGIIGSILITIFSKIKKEAYV